MCSCAGGGGGLACHRCLRRRRRTPPHPPSITPSSVFPPPPSTTVTMHTLRSEFQRALGYRGRSSRFVERIFALFDGNGDGHITFPEFIKGIALLSPNGTQKEKTKCA